MNRFTKSFKHFTLTNDDRFNLTEIETTGSTVEEMVDNCKISVESWHGESSYSYVMLTDLWDSDIQLITEIFEEHLAFDSNLPLVI